MDPAEIRFNQKVLFKERGAEDFRKIRPSPILWGPFKEFVSKKPTAVQDGAVTWKVSRNMGDGVFLMTTYRKNLILARSIWTVPLMHKKSIRLLVYFSRLLEDVCSGER